MRRGCRWKHPAPAVCRMGDDMLLSMTGFGEAVAPGPGCYVRVRVRTLNSRTLRLNFHMPAELDWRAPDLQGLVREHFSRGTIDIWVDVLRENGGGAASVDESAAAAYAEKLEELRKKLGLAGKVDMQLISGLPGVIRVEERAGGGELWEAACKVVKEAAGKAVEMRTSEGRSIAEEILGIAGRIESLVERARGKAPKVVEEYREKLVSRLRSLAGAELRVISDEDLIREVAIFADRASISEELSRLSGHTGLLRRTIGSEGPSGRRLEFVVQEMLREASTLAAKANDFELSQISVELRGEIEKIKEQARNVE